LKTQGIDFTTMGNSPFAFVTMVGRHFSRGAFWGKTTENFGDPNLKKAPLSTLHPKRKTRSTERLIGEILKRGSKKYRTLLYNTHVGEPNRNTIQTILIWEDSKNL